MASQNTIIGYLCWWTMGTIRVTRTEVFSLLEKFKIGYKLPSAVNCQVFLQSIREVSAKTGKEIWKIKKSSGQYKFAIAEQDRAVTVALNTDTGEIFSSDMDHPIVKQVTDTYCTHKEELTPTQLNQMISSLLSQLSPVCIQDPWLIEFVPFLFADRLVKIQALVIALPIGCNFYAMPQIDSEATTLPIYKGLHTAVDARLDEIDRDVTEVKTNRRNAINIRIAELQKLREKIELYHGLLQFKVDYLLERIVKLEKIANARLLECRQCTEPTLAV
ncbi:MAG: hypothetical protein NTW48_09065 [Chloroflexi bacterium]|nr:hypothetical protein [Chloroflexota bacterium]